MDANHRQRANRVSVLRECVMVDEFNDERPAKIIDISRDGFRLKASDCPDAGDYIRLLVDGYDFRCQIIWTHYGEVGGTFLEHVELGDQERDIMKNPKLAQLDRRSEADRRQSQLPQDRLTAPDRRTSDRRDLARRELDEGSITE